MRIVDCAVIPAYNEVSTIADVIRKAKRYVRVCIVVDDASSDETYFVAQASGADAIRLPKNIGTGKAVQIGLQYAQSLRYSSVVLLDADGQHNPDDIPRLAVSLLGDTDLVIGSRYLKNSASSTSFLRVLGTSFISFLLTALWGVSVKDPTSGFRIFNQRVLRVFSEHYPSVFPEPESLLLLKDEFTIREVPVQMFKRQHGRSSIAGYRGAALMIYILVVFIRNALFPVKR
jgi:glycosyltransferase involved in cell wall biosynthesis